MDYSALSPKPYPMWPILILWIMLEVVWWLIKKELRKEKMRKNKG